MMLHLIIMTVTIVTENALTSQSMGSIALPYTPVACEVSLVNIKVLSCSLQPQVIPYEEYLYFTSFIIFTLDYNYCNIISGVSPTTITSSLSLCQHSLATIM